MSKTRCVVLLLAALLCMASAGMGEGAGELPAALFDEWYGQMTYLTEEIGTRQIASEGQAEAYEYLLGQYQAMGFDEGAGTLEKSVCQAWERELISLVGIKPARGERPWIVTLCAHYDSNGPGARDNASGVAALLALMHYFSALPDYEDTELRFIAFTAEETGHQGSMAYVDGLTEDEKARSLAVFNMDILAVDVWDTEAAFSCDTLGMRTQAGYVEGTDRQPVANKAARAILRAMEQVGGFEPEDAGAVYCVPRHKGDSDHDSFHAAGIDAANICFRGNVEAGGHWPEQMHTDDDVMGDFDLERSRQALDVVLTAVTGLAVSAGYGG